MDFSLPPEYQIHAYNQFREHAAKEGYGDYVPAVNDPAQLPEMLGKLKYASGVAMKNFKEQLEITKAQRDLNKPQLEKIREGDQEVTYKVGEGGKLDKIASGDLRADSQTRLYEKAAGGDKQALAAVQLEQDIKDKGQDRIDARQDKRIDAAERAREEKSPKLTAYEQAFVDAARRKRTK